MSGNCELGRGLRRRKKNATEAGAGRFEKPALDARAAPPEAHESLISRKTVEDVPLTGLSLAPGESNDFERSESLLYQASLPFPSGSLEIHPSVVSWGRVG